METGIYDLVSDHGIDGGDEPHLFTGRFENMIDQIGGGGLAVRTRNSDDGHFSGGKIIKGSGQIGHGFARVFNAQIRDRQ
ncbi:hypothetical protein SDC9_170270 [bioreactor metagenome]|uniref:Uncharacterized protein n=1 Tax=bioreactor metagenome TaxID=1076179 RepID=A0A645G8C4_9ZZZZ